MWQILPACHVFVNIILASNFGKVLPMARKLQIDFIYFTSHLIDPEKMKSKVDLHGWKVGRNDIKHPTRHANGIACSAPIFIFNI